MQKGKRIKEDIKITEIKSWKILKKLWIPYINQNFVLSVLIAKWNSNIQHFLRMAIALVKYVVNILL